MFVKVDDWDRVCDLFEAGLLWGTMDSGHTFIPLTRPEGPVTRIRQPTLYEGEQYGYMTED